MRFSENYKNKIFSVTSSSFEQYALELFYYQAKHTPVYRDFIRYLNIDPEHVVSLDAIPFIPIDFFKELGKKIVICKILAIS